ncbi:MAG: RNA pseudouridine synthase [Hyphomicrobiaceae bacterium]
MPRAISKQPKPPLVYAPPVEPYLDVLHVDADLLVVSKPSGLLSVPGRGPTLADCVAARAAALYPDTTIVHRLDLDTSGVMVLARNRAAHRHIGLQFEKRQVAKVYFARVWGDIRDDAGVIDAPLRCDWPNRPRQMIDPLLGRAALTSWQVVCREADATRVRLVPGTGRSHQLRVHMLSIGHPILGDNLYAHPTALAAATRLQLHAQSLSFCHPADGQRVTFENACPF